MVQHKIDIMAIQETHNIHENHYTQDGFLVILASSTPSDNGRSYTGLGYIIAPQIIPLIYKFIPHNSRIAALGLRTSIRPTLLINVYAPRQVNILEEDTTRKE